MLENLDAPNAQHKYAMCKDLRDPVDRAFAVLVRYTAMLPLPWVPLGALWQGPIPTVLRLCNIGHGCYGCTSSSNECKAMYIQNVLCPPLVPVSIHRMLHLRFSFSTAGTYCSDAFSFLII